MRRKRSHATSAVREFRTVRPHPAAPARSPSVLKSMFILPPEIDLPPNYILLPDGPVYMCGYPFLKIDPSPPNYIQFGPSPDDFWSQDKNRERKFPTIAYNFFLDSNTNIRFSVYEFCIRYAHVWWRPLESIRLEEWFFSLVEVYCKKRRRVFPLENLGLSRCAKIITVKNQTNYGSVFTTLGEFRDVLARMTVARLKYKPIE